MSFLTSVFCLRLRQRRTTPYSSPFTNLVASHKLSTTQSMVEHDPNVLPAAVHERRALNCLLLEEFAPAVIPTAQLPEVPSVEDIASRLRVRRCQRPPQTPCVRVWVVSDTAGLSLRLGGYVALSKPNGEPMGRVGYINGIVFTSPTTARLSIKGLEPGIMGYIFIDRTVVVPPAGRRSLCQRRRDDTSQPRSPPPLLEEIQAATPDHPLSHTMPVRSGTDLVAGSTATLTEPDATSVGGKAPTLSTQSSSVTLRAEGAHRARGGVQAGALTSQMTKPHIPILSGRSRPDGSTRTPPWVFNTSGRAVEEAVEYACRPPSRHSTLEEHMAKPVGL